MKILDRISASSVALWWLKLPSLKYLATVYSLQFLISGKIERQIATVSIEVRLYSTPILSQTALINDVSNGALWATTTAPSTNSRKSFTASSSSGASLTIPSLIPVSSTIFSGIGFSGLTKVSNVSTTTPFLIFTAPISVIFSFCAESPVVSISKQTNVPSRLSS